VARRRSPPRRAYSRDDVSWLHLVVFSSPPSAQLVRESPHPQPASTKDDCDSSASRSVIVALLGYRKWGRFSATSQRPSGCFLSEVRRGSHALPPTWQPSPLSREKVMMDQGPLSCWHEDDCRVASRASHRRAVAIECSSPGNMTAVTGDAVSRDGRLAGGRHSTDRPCESGRARRARGEPSRRIRSHVVKPVSPNRAHQTLGPLLAHSHVGEAGGSPWPPARRAADSSARDAGMKPCRDLRADRLACSDCRDSGSLRDQRVTAANVAREA